MRIARSAALVMAFGLIVSAMTLFGGSTARAAVLYNCGHEIRTSYHEGWVIIDSMTGIAGRDDIFVYGITSGPNGEWLEGLQSIHGAIRDRTRWGYDRSFVFLQYDENCVTWLQ